MKNKLHLQIIIFIFLSALSSNVTAQVSNSESFDVLPFPPTGWALTTPAGPNIWSRQMNGNNPMCTPHSGAGMARFFSDQTPAGNTQSLITPVVDYSVLGTDTARISLWIFRDQGGVAGVDSLTISVNTSASLTGAVRIGAIARHRLFFLPDTVSANGWYQYSFDVPQSFNTDTNYILLQGTSQQGNNIFIDDINWTSYPPPCTGTPTPGAITANPTVICGGSGSASLTLNGQTTGYGLTYEWQSAPAATGPFTSFVLGPLTTVFTGVITTDTYYRCISTCTFSGLSDTTAVITAAVSQNPLPVITASPTTVSYCTGTPAVLLTVSGGVTYSWSPVTGLDTSTGDSVYTTPTGNTAYIVTGYDSIGCASTDTVVVTIHNTPNVNATANPDSICTGSSSTLNATSGGPGITYVWNPGGFTGQNFTVSPTTTTTYVVTGTSMFGCVGTDSVTLNVYSNPVANFGYTVNGSTVTFHDSSLNAVTWQWNFGDGNGSFNQNPLYTYSFDSTYTVTLIVTNGVCPGGDTITITITIITAGINDLNGNDGIQIYPNPVANELSVISYQLSGKTEISIYNTLGEKIIHRLLYGEKNVVFDVSALPAGIYFIKMLDEKNISVTRKFVKM